MSLFGPIIEALNRHEVTYVIVGGFAVVLHGHNRLTADVDVVIALEADNCAKAILALTELGFKPRAPVNSADFADPEIRKEWVNQKGMTVFSMVDPAKPFISVDIFLEYPMPFADLYNRSQLVQATGTSIRICSIEDLIAMKSDAKRALDFEDAEALRKIRNARA